MPVRKRNYTRGKKATKKTTKRTASARKRVSKPRRRTKIGFTTLMATPGLGLAKRGSSINWGELGKFVGNIAVLIGNMALNMWNRNQLMKSFATYIGPLILKIVGRDGNGNKLNTVDGKLAKMMMNLENVMAMLPNINDPNATASYANAFKKVDDVKKFIIDNSDTMSYNAAQAGQGFLKLYDGIFNASGFNGTAFNKTK